MIPRRPAIPYFFFFALPLAISSVRAASYYVDYAAGSDVAAGTSTTAAWRHCPGDPAATGGPAAATLAAGDTVHFKGGVAYAMTGTTGITLKWNGSSTAPITYDGNSANTWGTGRARLTDNNGGASITAFTAKSAAANLVFRSLEFVAIGGSGSVPADLGAPVSPRYGGGIDFKLGVSDTVIDGCVFHQLGYFFNAKPMNAAAINGIGLRLASADTVTISSCEFAQVGTAIEMYGASSLANVTISGCTFHDNVCWTIDLPPAWVRPTNLLVTGCAETNNAQFTTGTWTGYGASPRTTVRTANAGTYVGMSVTLAATPTVTFQWRKNGTPIPGATTANLGLSSVTASDAGTYTVIAKNATGVATSNDIILTIAAATTSTVTASTTADTASLSPSAPPVVASIPSAPSASAPTPSSSTSTKAPSPSAVAQTSSSPAPTTPASTVATTAVVPSRLTNVSVRGDVSTSTGPLIVGFVVSGSEHKSLLIRAVGPTLSHYGVPGALPDPALSLYSGHSLLAANAIWNSSANAAQLTAAAGTVGAFPLAADSADAALMPTVDSGAYTAQVRSAGGHEGVALVEVYDADRGTASKLINVSVRAHVGSGAGNPIIGFAVEGPTSKRLLIRAVGPTLAGFGVTDPLADPQLTLVRAGVTIASNDNWNGDKGVADAAASVGAFPLSVLTSKDSAIVIDAAPGVYSAVVNAADAGQGVVVLEVYELP